MREATNKLLFSGEITRMHSLYPLRASRQPFSPLRATQNAFSQRWTRVEPACGGQDRGPVWNIILSRTVYIQFSLLNWFRPSYASGRSLSVRTYILGGIHDRQRPNSCGCL